MNLLLLVSLCIAAVVALWAHHSRVSARARSYAQDYLTKQGLQLLDQSIVLESLRPSLYRGMPSLRRRFRFEFTARGDRRYLGWITLNAWATEHTELQPFAEDGLH